MLHIELEVDDAVNDNVKPVLWLIEREYRLASFDSLVGQQLTEIIQIFANYILFFKKVEIFYEGKNG